MTMPPVSVVVPTYNEAGNIAMIYDGLAQALAGRAWELVVVDDDSPDGTADAVRALGLATTMSGASSASRSAASPRPSTGACRPRMAR